MNSYQPWSIPYCQYQSPIVNAAQKGAIAAAAGIFGPVLVNYIREYQLDQGVARADAYTITMYILAVWIPLGWGGWMTVQKTIVFFK